MKLRKAQKPFLAKPAPSIIISRRQYAYGSSAYIAAGGSAKCKW